MLLIKRNHTFYFRWQIPPDVRNIVNQGELVKSLRTKDRALAVQRSVRFVRLVSEIKSARAAFKVKELTEDTYEEIVKSLWEKVDQEIPEPPVNVLFSEEKAKVNFDLERFKECAFAIPAEQCERFANGIDHTDTPYKANEIIDNNDYTELYELLRADLDLMDVSVKDKNIFFHLAHDYLNIHIHRLQKRKEFLNLDNFKPKIPPYISSGKVNAQSNTQANNSILLSQAWQRYAQDKKDSGKWKALNKIGERQAEFYDLIEILGGDLPCHAIDREKATQTRAALRKLPKNRRKLFGDTKLEDIPDNVEKISESTASQRLDNIKGFFKYLVQEQFIEKSPFDKIDITAEKISYATYADEDLRELFNLDKALIKTPWQFWIPRIALYTGARQSEIAQLTVRDVHNDQESRVWFFSINVQGGKRVKTSAAIRRIPIHSDLIENGFLEYYEKIKKENSGNGSLWPELKPKGGSLGQNVSRYWGGLNKKHKVLSNPEGHQGSRKTFHSLRRVMINKLRQADVPTETIQILVGHEPTMGETATYVDFDAIPIKKLSGVIEKLKFPQVGWD